MKHILILIQRELTFYRNFLLAATVLGLFPLMFPLLPIGETVSFSTGREIIAIAALFISGIVTGGLAVITGASGIGHQLSERRLSFYFAFPFSEAEIWTGKVLGGLAVTLLAGLLSVLPGMIPSLVHGQGGLKLLTWQVAAGLSVEAVVLFGLGLVLGVAFRSKSWWLAFDLSALLVGLFLVSFGLSRLQMAEALDCAVTAVSGLGLLALLGFFGASAMSVALGRTDIRRVHKMLSLTFWSVMLCGTMLSEGYSRWVVAAAPDDLLGVEWCLPAPNGNWAMINGTAKWRGYYKPWFLKDFSTGRYLSLDSLHGDFGFSQDGKRAAWIDTRAPFLLKSTTAQLVLCNLDETNPTPRQTKGAYELNSRVKLNDDGSRVALFTRNQVTFVDFQTGRELGTVVIPPSANPGELLLSSFFFVGPDTVRIYRTSINPSKSHTNEIVEISLATGKVQTVGRIDGSVLYQTATRARVLASHSTSDRRTVTLNDGQTGTQIAELASVAANPLPNAQSTTYLSSEILADGRVVVIKKEKDLRQALVFSAEGKLERTLELPSGSGDLRLYGEPVAGKVYLSIESSDKTPVNPGLSLYLVDLATGDLALQPHGLTPLYINILNSPFVTPGSLSSRLAYRYTGKSTNRDSRSLVLHNPETGETRALAGPNVN